MPAPTLSTLGASPEQSGIEQTVCFRVAIKATPLSLSARDEYHVFETPAKERRSPSSPGSAGEALRNHIIFAANHPEAIEHFLTPPNTPTRFNESLLLQNNVPWDPDEPTTWPTLCLPFHRSAAIAVRGALRYGDWRRPGCDGTNGVPLLAFQHDNEWVLERRMWNDRRHENLER